MLRLIAMTVKAAHAHGIGEGAERLGAFHCLMKIRVGFLDAFLGTAPDAREAATIVRVEGTAGT